MNRPIVALAYPFAATLLLLAMILWGPGAKAAAQPRADAEAVKERGADSPAPGELQVGQEEAFRVVRSALAWYQGTPPLDRSTWGGLAACVALGLVVLVERTFRLRSRKVVPADFTARFLDRLYEGKLDGGKALDYCEMNPSPAARVALAAVRRWGRPAVDLERAVALAHRVETERLRRNVGTLRRIAALAPLLGLLGTLLSVGRVLAALPGAGSLSGSDLTNSAAAWGPAISAAISPLTLGVAIATLALAAYDALQVRIERLAGALDRLGAETIDAIAMATPPTPPTLLAAPSQTRRGEWHSGHDHGTLGAAGSPHRPSGGRPHIDPQAGPPERGTPGSPRLVGSGPATVERQDVEVADAPRRKARDLPDIGF
jgi:biopolymer transport protein ExbB